MFSLPTSNDIHHAVTHPNIVPSHPPIHTAGPHLPASNSNIRHTILALIKHHHRPVALSFRVPEPYRSVEAATDDHAVLLSAELDTLDLASMTPRTTTETSQRLAVGDIPDEERLITSTTNEAAIVG